MTSPVGQVQFDKEWLARLHHQVVINVGSYDCPAPELYSIIAL